MNSIKDFQKKTNGAVVNTNSKDFMRARNRNHIRRVQQKMFGNHIEEGAIDKVVRYQNHDHEVIREIKSDIEQVKNMLVQLLGDK